MLFERPRPRRDVLFAPARGFSPNAAVALMNSTVSGLIQDVLKRVPELILRSDEPRSSKLMVDACRSAGWKSESSVIEHRLVSDTLRTRLGTEPKLPHDTLCLKKVKESKLPYDELRLRTASSSDVKLLRDDLRRKHSGCSVLVVGSRDLQRRAPDATI